MLPDNQNQCAYFPARKQTGENKRKGKAASFVLSEKAIENLRRAANRACKSQSETLRDLLESLEPK